MLLCRLTKEYIQPFSNFLYPILGQQLDSHHGFVVEYELGKDINLGFHVDDSEVPYLVYYALHSLIMACLAGDTECVSGRSVHWRPALF